MKLQYVIQKHVSEVELKKPKKENVGLNITGSDKDIEWPVITYIRDGTIGQRSHCLAVGDFILSINGHDCRRMDKKGVSSLFKKSDGKVNIKVGYTTREASFGYCRLSRSQRMFLTLKKDRETFGFVLRKSSEDMEYPVISNIKCGGPADKEGSMMAGDRLLEVDNKSLSWISLAEAALLLQEKNEAVFLIEYNVGIIEIAKEKEILVEIDCPGLEFGMTVSHDEDYNMNINFIEHGSLAQRCGAFHVGDQIQTINGIKSNSLTTTKANEILKLFKKNPGALTFIRKREPSAQEYAKGRTQLSLIPLQHRMPNSSKTTSLNNFVPPNSLSSSYMDPIREDSFFKSTVTEANYDDCLLKTMAILKNINASLNDLLQNLSQGYLDETSHETRLKPFTLFNTSFRREEVYKQIRLKSQCRSIRVLVRELTTHMIKNSSLMNVSQEDSSSNKISNEENVPKSSYLVDDLIKSLNDIAAHNLISEHYITRFMESVNKVDINCIVCKRTCYTAQFAFLKILLFLSMTGSSSEEANIIKGVLNQVCNMSLPCSDCKSWCSGSRNEDVKNKPKTLGRNFSKILRSFGVGASRSISEDTSKGCTRQLLATEKSSYFKGEPSVGLNVPQQTAVYRLTDIQVEKNNEESSSKKNSSKIHDNHQEKKGSAKKEKTVGADASGNSYFPSKKQQENLKYLSLESIPLFEEIDEDLEFLNKKKSKPTEELLETRVEDSQNNISVRPKTTAPKCLNSPPSCSRRTFSRCNHDSLGFESAEEYEGPTTGRCFSSDKCLSQNPKNIKPIKTYRDVQDVILKAENGRFGIVLGYCDLNDENNRLPIIDIIKPKSPAYACGILKKGDRIIALNGISTSGMSIQELEELKREIFSFDEIILRVEFDVVDAETKWEEFTVHLDGEVKLGLKLETKDRVTFVKGVHRGSAAHRSGQFYAGDEIRSVIIKQDTKYDFQAGGTHTRSTTYELVVWRAKNSIPYRSIGNRTLDASFNPIAPVRKGSDFNIKRTSLRNVIGAEGAEKMILEQELVLYKDPLSWDFGFAYADDPKVGKAYISDIRPGGPAENCKVLKRYDRILEINGISVDGKTENSITNLMMQCDDRITLLTRRELKYF